MFCSAKLDSARDRNILPPFDRKPLFDFRANRLLMVQTTIYRSFYTVRNG